MTETINGVTYISPPVHHTPTGYLRFSFCCKVYPDGARIFGVTVVGVDGVAWLRLASNGALWLETPDGAAVRAADPVPLDTWVRIRVRLIGERAVSVTPEEKVG